MESTRTGEEGRMVFISNDEYYELQAKCIAQTKDAYSVLLPAQQPLEGLPGPSSTTSWTRACGRSIRSLTA